MNPEYRGTIYADFLAAAIQHFDDRHYAERAAAAAKLADYMLAEYEERFPAPVHGEPAARMLSQVWLSPGQRSATARKANAARARRGEPAARMLLSRPKASRRKIII